MSSNRSDRIDDIGTSISTLTLVIEDNTGAEQAWRTFENAPALRRLVRDVVLLNGRSETGIPGLETHTVRWERSNDGHSKYTIAGALSKGTMLLFLKNTSYFGLLTKTILDTLISRLTTSNELLAMEVVDLSGTSTQQDRRVAIPGIIAFRKENISDLLSVEIRLERNERAVPIVQELADEILLSLLFFYRYQTLARPLAGNGSRLQSLHLPLSRKTVYGIRRNYRILEGRLLDALFDTNRIPNSELSKPNGYSFEPKRVSSYD